MSGVVTLNNDEISNFRIIYKCECLELFEKTLGRGYNKTYKLITALEADWPKCPVCEANLAIDRMEYDYN